MEIKILQLNIWAGTHFPVIKKFIEENDFDILCFQEVAGANTIIGNIHTKINYLLALQEILGTTHEVDFAIADTFTSGPESFMGNAIFYRKRFLLQGKNILYLHQNAKPFLSTLTTFEEVGRNVLHLTLSLGNQKIDVLTGHLAWGPTPLERPHQRAQNTKLVEYVKHLKNPFILTGDFNITPDQPTVVALEQFGQNLTTKYHVPNTLDPYNHTAWEKIQPGFSVDYIFISPQIKVVHFEVLDTIHMSDHLGLTATVEI